MCRPAEAGPYVCTRIDHMADAPKSAYELAMERLRSKDAEQGIVPQSLTAEQKTEIADIRQTYAAKLAQEEILHQSRRREARSHEELQTLDDNYRRELQRLNDERDRQIEKVRHG